MIKLLDLPKINLFYWQKIEWRLLSFFCVCFRFRNGFFGYQNKKNIKIKGFSLRLPPYFSCIFLLSKAESLQGSMKKTKENGHENK